MTRSYVPLILLLSSLWGASYLFIKVAGREISPAPMMLARVTVAIVLLLTFLAARGELGRLRAPWGAYALGVTNSAVPFTLIAWGERHIDSGVAAVANASVPIFVAILAVWFRPDERSRGWRLVGILLGIVGVAVLAGSSPGSGWWYVAGTLAVVLASISYATAGLWGKHLIVRTPGPVLATTSLIGAFVVLLPFGVAQAPSELPSAKAIGCVLALAVLGTAAAQLIWFRLLRSFGTSRSSLVTYLMPATALLYGVLLLGEPITWSELAGFVLILGGVALGSGIFAGRIQPEPQSAEPQPAPAR